MSEHFGREYSEQFVFHCGLEHRDESWWRPYGWGMPDEMVTEPVVPVPAQHARRILMHSHLTARITHLQAVVEAWRERHAVAISLCGNCCTRDDVEFAARDDRSISRLVELDQIEPPQEGCCLQLKEPAP